MFKLKMLFKTLFGFAATGMALGLFWIACNQNIPIDPTQTLQENLPLLASMMANPSQVVAGDSAQVLVRLIDQDNQPMIDKSVQFAVNTDLVQIRQTVVNTDTSGWAITWINSSPSAREAIVSATYGETTRASITIQFITSQSSHLKIVSAANQLLADGVSETTISVTLSGDSTLPVANAPINFYTTAGTIDASGFTDSNGELEVTLKAASSWTNVTAVITASHDSDSVATSVLFRGVTLEVSSNPEAILADGQSTSSINAVLKETTRNVVISNKPVQFQTDKGTLLKGQVLTNDEGLAQSTLRSTNVADTANVVVYFGPVLNRSIQVVFRESLAGNMILTANPDALVADRQTQSTITARVTDANQYPVAGTTVRYAFADKPANEDWGTIIPEAAVTNLDGVCSVTLTSSNSILAVKIRAHATVTTDTGNVVIADTVNVNYVAGEISSLQLAVRKFDSGSNSWVTSDKVKADGIDQVRVIATVKDAEGHGLIGVPVHFVTTIGDITPTDDSDENGDAEATFSSGVVGVATVTATATVNGKTVQGTTTIRALPGEPHSIVLNFNPTAIGVKGTGQNQTATIEAEVRDAKNNPVVDSTLVRFSIVHQPGGVSLSSYGNIPTVGGKARVSISSGTIAGNVRIRAEVIDSENNAVVIAEASEILVHAGPPFMEDKTKYYTTHLTVRAEQYNIWRALGTTQLNIAVFDKYHNPVQQGTAVYLTTSGGGVSTHTAYTDDQGKASVILTGANPQPLIANYYYGTLMQDPNDSSIVLPGPQSYNALGQNLIPNFDGDFINGYPGTLNGTITNSMDDSLDTAPRYTAAAPAVYRNLENDGVARVIAYTEGVDANGDSLRAWDNIAVVYSGAVGYSDDSGTSFHTPDNVLYLGESRVLTFTLMDDNGNPIESNSDLIAKLVPGDISAALSWESKQTGSGWGTSYYHLTISNSISADDENPKAGFVAIQIEWSNDHQFGDASTHQIFISTLTRAQAQKGE